MRSDAIRPNPASRIATSKLPVVQERTRLSAIFEDRGHRRSSTCPPEPAARRCGQGVLSRGHPLQRHLSDAAMVWPGGLPTILNLDDPGTRFLPDRSLTPVPRDDEHVVHPDHFSVNPAHPGPDGRLYISTRTTRRPGSGQILLSGRSFMIPASAELREFSDVGISPTDPADYVGRQVRLGRSTSPSPGLARFLASEASRIKAAAYRPDDRPAQALLRAGPPSRSCASGSRAGALGGKARKVVSDRSHATPRDESSAPRPSSALDGHMARYRPGPEPQNPSTGSIPADRRTLLQQLLVRALPRVERTARRTTSSISSSGSGSAWGRGPSSFRSATASFCSSPDTAKPWARSIPASCRRIGPYCD
jgi:hypothetical protein